MRAKHTVDGLALAGALVALAGVLFAADSAFADEAQAIDSNKNSIEETGLDTVEEAAAANTEAAAEAAEAVQREARLELAIGLDARRSEILVVRR